MQTRLIRRRELKHVLSSEPLPRTFVAKKELECDSISGVPGHDHGHEHHGGRLPPLRRFLGLLRFDGRDIWIVMLFAFVSGTLASGHTAGGRSAGQRRQLGNLFSAAVVSWPGCC